MDFALTFEIVLQTLILKYDECFHLNELTGLFKISAAHISLLHRICSGDITTKINESENGRVVRFQR